MFGDIELRLKQGKWVAAVLGYRPLVFIQVVFGTVLLIGCNPGDAEESVCRGNYCAWAEKKREDVFIVRLARKLEGDTLVLPLPFPVYRIAIGDLDGNGKDDLLVGVIKKTRMDPVKRKRVFAYKVVDDFLAPQWLGSRLAQLPVDFDFRPQGDSLVFTSIEQEMEGRYCIGRYKPKKFGIRLREYDTCGISKEDAYRISGIDPDSHADGLRE